MRWVLSFFGLMFVIFLVLFFGAVIVSLFTVVGVARGATIQECVSYLNGQELLLTCEEAWLIRTDAEPPCLKLMEEAMRTMQPYIRPFVDPEQRRRDALGKGAYLTDDLICRGSWCGGGIEYRDLRSIEERLADDRRRYEREQETRGREIIDDARERFAYHLWATTQKECYR